MRKHAKQLVNDREYAVFDWDNTVRNGFTLFDWIDYLTLNQIIDDSVKNMIRIYSDEYKVGKLSHDDYAHFACREYAKAVKGISPSFLESIAKEYMFHDRKKIFDGMQNIFGLLTENNIDIVVISGAPMIVLDQYRKDYNIRFIKAFKERVVKGYCNGQVKYNYGYNKIKTIISLEKQYEKKPLFGFGDSHSDLPIIQEAKHSFSVGTNLDGATKIDVINNSITPESLIAVKTAILKK